MSLSSVPIIPGKVESDAVASGLRRELASLCNCKYDSFPGSLPVTLSAPSLKLLETMNYGVSEKSDGIRALLFVRNREDTQDVWLVDRKQRFYHQTGFRLPRDWSSGGLKLNTVLDGELVNDIEHASKVILRFYVFDCLVMDGKNVMKLPMKRRTELLKDKRYMNDRASRDHSRRSAPFEIIRKTYEPAFDVEKVINNRIPKLRHAHDGLIFSCLDLPYWSGTDKRLLKWKSPSQISIDFRLQVLPPLPLPGPDTALPVRPRLMLCCWRGNDVYEHFEETVPKPEEWESLLLSQHTLDKRIVEVVRGTDRRSWQIVRFRDDKVHANHIDIVRRLIEEIEHGVELKTLLSSSTAIRIAWATRFSHGHVTGLPA